MIEAFFRAKRRIEEHKSGTNGHSNIFGMLNTAEVKINMNGKQLRWIGRAIMSAIAIL